jgi:hypothetical protein
LIPVPPGFGTIPETVRIQADLKKWHPGKLHVDMWFFQHREDQKGKKNNPVLEVIEIFDTFL